MKLSIFYPVIFGIFISAFYSCKEKEITPEISNVTAVNHDDGSTQITLGGTVSVNFDAISRSGARLDFYHIEIHDHPASQIIADEYKIIDGDFKNLSTFSGLVNAHVHEHITVPEIANTGSYHVVVVVVDEDGNSSDTEELETHIEIIE